MNIFRKLHALVILLSVAFLACEKDINEGIQNTEQTIVKLPQAIDEIHTIAVDALPGVITINVLEVRRDPKTESDLNSTLVVKIAPNPALLAAYNSTHGTTYQTFTAYTLDPSTPFDGQLWTVTFQPGEFVKFIKISFDPTLLDLSKQYAIGFKISQAEGAFISNSKMEALVEIAVKNEYHGLYHSTGVFHHPVNGDRAIDEDKMLVTTGPKSVKTSLGDVGGLGYQMILTVNANNTVTITPAGVTPNVDQSWGANYYDPVTKTFHLHYSYNTAAPRIIEETITRL